MDVKSEVGYEKKLKEEMWFLLGGRGKEVMGD